MRNHVYFQADFDVEGCPPGEHLATWVQDVLSAAGAELQDHTRSSRLHLLRFQLGKRRYRIALGLVEIDPARWLLIADSTLSRFRRLLGTRDLEQYGVLLRILEEALEEPRFQAVEWYSKERWAASRAAPANQPNP